MYGKEEPHKKSIKNDPSSNQKSSSDFKHFKGRSFKLSPKVNEDSKIAREPLETGDRRKNSKENRLKPEIEEKIQKENRLKPEIEEKIQKENRLKS